MINGAGAAGIAIGRFLLKLGVKDVTLCDLKGIVCDGEEWLNPAQKQVAKITNLSHAKGKLADAMRGADVFIGVSGPHCVTKEMVRSMAENRTVHLRKPRPRNRAGGRFGGRCVHSRNGIFRTPQSDK